MFSGTHGGTASSFPSFLGPRLQVTWINVKMHRTLPVLDFHLDILSLSVGSAYHLINCAEAEADQQDEKSNSCQTRQLCRPVPPSPPSFLPFVSLTRTQNTKCCFNTITLIQLILTDTLNEKKPGLI